MANETDWEGQKKINGQLCRVDWRLVIALKEVMRAIAACPACAGVDFTDLNNAIEAAEAISAKVADIKPPGCDPRDQTGDV